MTNYLLSFLYFVFLVAAVYLEKNRFNNQNGIDLLSVVKAVFLINLVFPPIGMYLVLDDVDLSNTNVFLRNVFTYAQFVDHFYVFLLTVYSYAFICIGYSTFSNSYSQPVDIISSSKGERKYFLIWFVGFLILAISIVGFLHAFGGNIISNIFVAGRYRTGVIKLSGNGASVFYFFLSILMPIALFPTFSLARSRISKNAWFILELFLVVIVAIIVGSRRLILVWLFLKFILNMAVAKTKKIKRTPFVIAVIVSFIIVLNGKRFLYLLGADDGDFDTMDLATDSSFSDNLFSTLGDIGISFSESLGMVSFYHGGFRYGIDSLLTVLAILPNKLLGVIGLELPERFVRYSTYLLSGDPKEADIPPGFVGYMWVNLGFVGVVIQSFIYGFVSAFVANIIGWLRNHRVGIFLYVMFSYFWSVIINSGNWEYWIKDNIVAISWCIVLYVFINKTMVINKNNGKLIP